MEDIQFQRHYELSSTHWWYVATHHFFLRLLRRYAPQAQWILDAGCGVGGLMRMLLKSYPHVWGLDSSKVALDYCRVNHLRNLFEGTIESLPFESGKFDAVVSLDVLYHQNVHSENQALAELHRVLKPGGFLFLQLPAYEWMRSGHDRLAQTARRYTSQGLGRLLKANQFELIRITYRVSLLFPWAVMSRKLFGAKASEMKATPVIMNEICKGIMSIENFFLEYFNLPFGLSVVAVARKKGAN